MFRFRRPNTFASHRLSVVDRHRVSFGRAFTALLPSPLDRFAVAFQRPCRIQCLLAVYLAVFCLWPPLVSGFDTICLWSPCFGSRPGHGLGLLYIGRSSSPVSGHRFALLPLARWGLSRTCSHSFAPDLAAPRAAMGLANAIGGSAPASVRWLTVMKLQNFP